MAASRAMLLAWLLTSAPAAVAGAAAPAGLSSSGGGGSGPRILAFLGRADAAEHAYEALLEALRAEAASAAAAGAARLHVVAAGSWEGLAQRVREAQAELPEAARVVYVGHGMLGGAATVQDEAPGQASVDGIVLVGGFLRRTWRPGVARCKSLWGVQPTRRCPKGKGLPLCPGGYLPEGVHNCSGLDSPAPAYAVPSLTIGGELDGVARIARLAEAWYTQRDSAAHAVAVVEGMNHGDLLTDIPEVVALRDLASEIGSRAACLAVAKLVVAFAADPHGFQPPALDGYFAPFVKMFVEQEGSWWWTSNSDEQGASAWAATAQQRMAEPMPPGFETWQLANGFHMLSDEEWIPPYYRSKHRPNVTMSADNRTLLSSTVAQLRYVKVSVSKTLAGLNGWAIIEEEKAGVLSHPGFADDGAEPIAAIEIAVKMASRQLAHRAAGVVDPPASLDDGDRCRSINEAALALALRAASPAARERFEARGRPLVLGPDRKPTPPAGPWWIWSYLDFRDLGETGLEVRSWYAFYPLSGPAYGAGNHYCKLLSPAWALEWVYTDSLRPRPAAGAAAEEPSLVAV